MDPWGEFQGVNAGFVLELYERYRRDPASVDDATRAYFARWTPPANGKPPAELPATLKIVGAVTLAQAIRGYGHLAARLDPLGGPPPGDPSLDPATHGITEEDLGQLPASPIGGPAAEGAANALDAIQRLTRVYSSTTGYGYAHIHNPEERAWLRHAAESGIFRPPHDPLDPIALLERLTSVEAFEQFLHRVFPGKTRFSLEGLDMLIPMLDEIIGEAAETGTRSILIGMGHRGRLNVLAHILRLPYAQILAEFRDPARGRRFTFREDLSWTGDVKYHMGAHRALKGGEPLDLTVTIPPNSSHLEYVNPVVEGMARAAGTQADRPGAPRFEPTAALPILIHGDAAFPGQGVVAETLNLSRLAGYQTGGTIHIITNNQLGFTVTPTEGRSTLYASDLAKGFEIPIVHVNADDPEACIEAAHLASNYRQTFHKDFLIDLVGYRRYGHNEGDEPSFTQPLMYERIAGHPTVREQWAERLVQQGRIEPARPKALVDACMSNLQGVLESLQPERDLVEFPPAPPPKGAARRVKTGVPADRLRAMHAALLEIPDGFTPHPKLERAMRKRRVALDKLDEATIDWATAEELAFAAILADGIPIRLTGEDVERGTFGQRHAVFHDAKTERTFVPLQALPQARAAFAIFNSPLTENATLAFEYGCNVQAPGRLVIWEAQYGDFVNGAQVVIDEYIVSARAKWGQTPSLVLLLPHGFEGQGPDHSSARPERFLELAAEMNLRIANATTAAQYFHLLQRQAALLETDPLPLLILAPKSLLRHPLTYSTLRDLAEGHFHPVLEDPRARQAAEQVRRLILCTGKVYVDLVSHPQRETSPSVAILRMEQLYPFPGEELVRILAGYPHLEEVIWLQEEPMNMGACSYMHPRVGELVKGRWPLRYMGRPPNSSPAEGSAAWHAVNQKALMNHAYDLRSRVPEDVIISTDERKMTNDQ